MQYRLKIWGHSELVETRIYVNGGMLERSDKLFIHSGRNRADWDATLRGDFSSWSLKNHGRGSNQKDIGLTIAEEALAERGWDKLGFLEILAKLRNGEEPKEPVNVRPSATVEESWTDEDQANLDEMANMSPEQVAAALKR